MHVIKCLAYSAHRHTRMGKARFEHVDGTATTMGALPSPIPSRGIASYFRFVIRLTNQRIAIFKGGISDF